MLYNGISIVIALKMEFITQHNLPIFGPNTEPSSDTLRPNIEPTCDINGPNIEPRCDISRSINITSININCTNLISPTIGNENVRRLDGIILVYHIGLHVDDVNGSVNYINISINLTIQNDLTISNIVK